MSSKNQRDRQSQHASQDPDKKSLDGAAFVGFPTDREGKNQR
jgi:hypothetical protein